MILVPVPDLSACPEPGRRRAVGLQPRGSMERLRRGGRDRGSDRGPRHRRSSPQGGGGGSRGARALAQLRGILGRAARRLSRGLIRLRCLRNTESGRGSSLTSVGFTITPQELHPRELDTFLTWQRKTFSLSPNKIVSPGTSTENYYLLLNGVWTICTDL